MGACVGKQMSLEKVLAKALQRRDRQALIDLSNDDINISHEFLVELGTQEWREGLIIFQQRFNRWDIPIRHVLTDWYCDKSPIIAATLFNYCPTNQRNRVVDVLYGIYVQNEDYLDRMHIIKAFIVERREYLEPNKSNTLITLIAPPSSQPKKQTTSLSPQPKPLSGVKPVGKTKSEPLSLLEPRSTSPQQKFSPRHEEEDSDCPNFLQRRNG